MLQQPVLIQLSISLDPNNIAHQQMLAMVVELMDQQKCQQVISVEPAKDSLAQEQVGREITPSFCPPLWGGRR